MIALERESVMAAHWRDADYARIFVHGTVERLALVMEESGGLLAFIVAANVGPEWEIENIVVATGARRRGLGTRLVGTLINMARAEGAARVLLEVRESNSAARALYEKWAFVQIGRRMGYYSGPAEDALLYRLDLCT